MVPAEEKKMVLCVDGDSESRQVLKDLLSAYEIGFACNAFEGIRELRGGVFDLYVLETSLPDWSGFQLCRQIRRADPRVPILFCTAATRVKDRMRGLRAGASAYIRKPVEPRELLTNVRVLINLAQIESAQARSEMHRVIHEELTCLSDELMKRSVRAKNVVCSALERTTKLKAMRAFAGAGGTHANFERWWLGMFADAWAQYDLQVAGNRHHATPHPMIH
jgi:DNA-binding response OmpR family regulator